LFHIYIYIYIWLCCDFPMTCWCELFYNYFNDEPFHYFFHPTFFSITFFFFFLIYVGCPGQLTRTTTIPHGPLDILQAQEQVRHRGGNRRAHRGSNPGRGRNKSHDWPQQLDPQVLCELEYFSLHVLENSSQSLIIDKFN